MSKRLLTRLNGRILNLLWSEGKIIECSAFPEQKNGLVLGGIYVAMVSQVIPRIKSAFLKVGNETLFYPLAEPSAQAAAGQAQKEKLKPGDELIVQVVREPIGSKDALAAGGVEVSGRYVLVSHITGQSGVSFSRKIKDNSWKDEIREKLSALLEDTSDLRFLVRTNAASVPADDIIKEAVSLKIRVERIIDHAQYLPAGSCLYRPEPDYIRLIRDTPSTELEEVVSDCEDLLREARNTLTADAAMQSVPFRLYDDPSLSFALCFGIESAIAQAMKKTVWLPCGGWLTIEQTEALTAVDVNSGKATKGYSDNPDESFLAVNLEAAEALAAQLRLRNVSGMILVDFINMKKKENEEKLLRVLNELARKDPVKTVIVDMTKLGLVEITRKKVRDTLDKQLNS